ncbi:aspartate-semialdehyde dehydrogenase [Marinitoga sp. 1197]|uniref:aspartate-semialdehyde dehydrogenase n=1 Tax=unclassified Marinitoga TaxID=2640159 RepID=UPI000641202E|nr:MULTISPECIES: aspartate-semialdehyde dehydrogenase [unclassified Marinitoga]KLO24365.1 aspartate-semialdehyde dehydrogenase [Marinitoga sp. 1155]KLO24437.1 aspartate-semialdehyde dehydrogenase [Marinitoga sp. 1197]NUU99749.1 aspartate-semialdehyde dehydrogenase [Marinitoga sp. 1154]
MKIGIVGATGEVGRTMIKVLEEFDLDITELRLFASKKSQGKEIKFKNKNYFVEELTEEKMKEHYDYLLFSAGSTISKKFAIIASKNGNTVIDNSSAFRMEKDIPLIVPEINGDIIKNYKGIIANPNCSTIQMVLALSNIQKEIGISEIFVSTYQAVSGAGNKGMKELLDQENGNNNINYFPDLIHHNVIPLIGNIMQNGFTEEEMKMVNETRKIFNNNKIKIYPTAVRVPVLYGHSESVAFKINGKSSVKELKKLISNVENVVYTEELITPLNVAGSNITYVSRLRQIEEDTFLLWIVADNVRVGAATNAVRILLKHYELNG